MTKLRQLWARIRPAHVTRGIGHRLDFYGR
jgi:hypothetical protein